MHNWQRSLAAFLPGSLTSRNPKSSLKYTGKGKKTSSVFLQEYPAKGVTQQTISFKFSVLLELNLPPTWELILLLLHKYAPAGLGGP